MSELPLPSAQGFDAVQFETISRAVESEFSVEDKMLELGVPTFYVKIRDDSKDAFLRLMPKLEEIGAIPVLRRQEDRTVLRVIPKPKVGKHRPIINILLLAATIVTTFVSGYGLSLGLLAVSPGALPHPYVGAVEFTVAILAILGAHEMGHKLTSDRHHVEATYPYFIPGLPPIGTFGAVIQQKSLSPNKDALFDLGASGPVIGFIVTIVVTAIGVALSPLELTATLPPGTNPLQVPLLFQFFEKVLVHAPTTSGDYSLLLHPVAFAGWVGMLVTMLNLLPTAMLDGGHTVRSLFGEITKLEKLAKWIFTFFSFAVLLLFGYWLMLIFVLFLSTFRHPGPLDDVSKLSAKRKIFSLLLIVIFVLSIAPLEPLF